MVLETCLEKVRCVIGVVVLRWRVLEKRAAIRAEYIAVGIEEQGDHVRRGIAAFKIC